MPFERKNCWKWPDYEEVSTEKPDTFVEALELVWLTQLIGNLEGGSALSLARFDQYMYPFYEKDMEEGN
ncbi:MAG: pyruvate formate lyase family protein [Eubacteriales bacterium]